VAATAARSFAVYLLRSVLRINNKMFVVLRPGLPNAHLAKCIDGLMSIAYHDPACPQARLRLHGHDTRGHAADSCRSPGVEGRPIPVGRADGTMKALFFFEPLPRVRSRGKENAWQPNPFIVNRASPFSVGRVAGAFQGAGPTWPRVSTGERRAGLWQPPGRRSGGSSKCFHGRAGSADPQSGRHPIPILLGEAVAHRVGTQAGTLEASPLGYAPHELSQSARPKRVAASHML